MFKLDMKKFDIARLKTGKTLKELGIDPNWLVRARRGRPLQVRTMAKIAKALNVDVLDLLESKQEHQGGTKDV